MPLLNSLYNTGPNMPIVIRKSDGKRITVPSGHFALTDDRFKLAEAKPKKAPRPKVKPLRKAGGK